MSELGNRFLRYLRRFGAGSMLISIIVHIILIGGATVWVVSTVTPKHKALFKGGSAQASAVQHPVKMSNTQPHLDTLTQRLSVDTPDSAVSLPDLPSLPESSGSPSLDSSISTPGAGAGPSLNAPIMPAFGFRDAQAGGTLVGHLYDLKQTPSHKPTGMDLLKYGKVVDDFLSQGWSISVLDRYYRAPHAIYTSQIFIPVLPADGGPKAFGQEKVVKPRLWLIHYKARVVVPSSGNWRFWGYGGEVCCVRVNGTTVLVANYVGSYLDVKTPRTHWTSSEPKRGQDAGSGQLVAGKWFEVRAGQTVDLQVLIGERGGGTFDCFLLIEKQGEKYDKVGDDFIYPIFQLTPYDTPVPKSKKSAPRFAPKGPVWKALK